MLKSLLSRQVKLTTRRAFVDLPSLRKLNDKVIKELSEFKQRNAFQDSLAAAVQDPGLYKVDVPENFALTPEEVKLVVKSGITTFLLHVEARVTSSAGQGFYTIGPCGEELLSTVGLSLAPTDASALHYRHVGTAVMRQLLAGKTIEEIALDRARGYTVSTLDPVTGGRHCAIGGSTYDFLVTSTLSSQCCPAVGRAQGIALAHALKAPSPFPKDAVSYVSLGDGSANNGHFLSALNLAEYSAFHRIKCPVVFAISDNGVSISLKDKGWLHELYGRLHMRKFIANGSDASDIHQQTKAAMHYARTFRRPALLVFKGLSRRFGHAGTDRQAAYLSPAEIEAAASRNDLFEFCKTAVASGSMEWTEIQSDFQSIQNTIEKSFETAANEPKITSNAALIESNSAPVQNNTSTTKPDTWDYSNNRENMYLSQKESGKKAPTGEVMRKLMTTLYEEALGGRTPAGEHVVYVGEDVRHGGYYLVTDGLASKYPLRVHDFPPDETALVGAAWGYSQAGMTPILEIPYAKYLDCASDMFHEICLTHWLTNGKEKPGLFIRLQGFDKGTFGGNFHTHNSLHIPPGLDVVCYSNGLDYVRGVKYLLRQTVAGRVCMSVDCTELLNRRHLYPELMDGLFLHTYPTTSNNTQETENKTENDELEMTFEDIVFYQPNTTTKAKCSSISKSQLNMSKIKVIVVSYGNGLPTSLIAMNNLIEKGEFTPEEVLIVDSPYLSRPPKQLELLLHEIKENNATTSTTTTTSTAVVFADICKEGPGMPFSSFIVKLQSIGVLPSQWRAIGAQNTYNPLGKLLTFLSPEDVENAVLAVTNKKEKK